MELVLEGNLAELARLAAEAERFAAGVRSPSKLSSTSTLRSNSS
ncbi:MAG TPA: hypothetical protein VMB03_08325 [Bryobacteraceae bacterium]|nr:hypothetical protein [Bryobacteraceae bacterium]